MWGVPGSETFRMDSVGICKAEECRPSAGLFHSRRAIVGAGLKSSSFPLFPGDMANFTEIYMIMELCDSDLKKLCRQERPWQQTILMNVLLFYGEPLRWSHNFLQAGCHPQPYSRDLARNGKHARIESLNSLQ